METESEELVQAARDLSRGAADLPGYVTELGNPGNERQVLRVEVALALAGDH